MAIVGAGLGGLAAALFLRRAGIEATLYEQAAELREVGAGIVVSPNMVRPLRRLGLGEALERVAVRLDSAWEFRRWDDGRVLFVQPLGEACERLYGAPCYVAHRADLHGLLRDALPEEALRLDHRCIAVEQHGAGAALTFARKSGADLRAEADVVVGADGIHSFIRDAVAPQAPASFSGSCAFRCLVPREHAPELALRPVQSLWLGPGRH
ncbi:MAG: FAD-dependent monooxygenase, partial [Burkholderiales bacterium]